MLTISRAVELTLNAILTVIHTAAITFTLFRTYYRTITRRLWWDDLVAFLAALLDCAYLSALWFEYARPGSMLQTHSELIVRYWLGLMLFLLVVWMSCISIALAIARIFQPKEPIRLLSIGLALTAMVLCLAIIIQSSVICAKQPALVSSPQAACQWSTRLRVFVVVANIFTDSLLVAIPLYKLWKVRLPRKQRRLVLGAFTASSTTTTATVACAVFQFAPERWEPAKTDLRGKLSYFETGISLIVCNLLVILTYLHMRLNRGEDLEVSDSETSCETRGPTISHSNLVPPTSSISETSMSAYTLTDISDAYVSVDSARAGTETPEISSTSTMAISMSNPITPHTQSDYYH